MKTFAIHVGGFVGLSLFLLAVLMALKGEAQEFIVAVCVALSNFFVYQWLKKDHGATGLQLYRIANMLAVTLPYVYVIWWLFNDIKHN